MPGHPAGVSVAVGSEEIGASLTRDRHESPTRQSIRLVMLADDLCVGGFGFCGFGPWAGGGAFPAAKRVEKARVWSAESCGESAGDLWGKGGGGFRERAPAQAG
jgi:hypothetical protein